MAPEFYGNNGYASEVDIWGFGMCVIEMATLSVPYAEHQEASAIKEAVMKVKKNETNFPIELLLINFREFCLMILPVLSHL